MSTKLNPKGSANASKLVNAGKVDKGDTWSAPSADTENNYIKNNGISEFGKWYLGVHSESPANEKGHYGYPFSSNFKTVSRKGIIAIEQRAAAQGASDIQNKAKSLLTKIDKGAKGSVFDENGEVDFFN
jgi:hypothetical protein